MAEKSVAADESSESAKRLSWAASVGFLALGIVAWLLLSSLLAAATQPRFWFAARDALGLPAFHVSLAFFVWGAIGEEISKAFGAWTARLRASQLSWWAIAAAIGASFGLIERVFLIMNWTLEFRAQFTPLEALSYDTIAVFSHAALCVLSVAIALALRGGWLGWCAGVLCAGLLHATHNLVPRFADLGYVWTAISATTMLIILVTTFVLRKQIAARAP